MPLIIPQTTLTDDFQDFPLSSNLIGGNLQITTNPAEVQLLYGGQGFVRDLQSQILTLGSYTVGRAPNGIPLAGIRARNASTGLGAVLAGYFWSESDPVLSFIGVASSQAVGAVVIPVVALADWPPSSPVDGQTVWLELPGATYNPIGGDDVRWLCTYDADGNVWSVQGHIHDQVEAAQSRNNTAYGDLATIGPDLVIPVAGDYVLKYGCAGVGFGGNDISFYSPSIGGAAALDINAATIRSWGAAGGDDGACYMEKLFTGMVALNTIVMKYRSFVPFNTTYDNRFLELQPMNIANA